MVGLSKNSDRKYTVNTLVLALGTLLSVLEASFCFPHTLCDLTHCVWVNPHCCPQLQRRCENVLAGLQMSAGWLVPEACRLPEDAQVLK